MSQASKPTQSGVQTCNGGCHCGAVRFEVALDLSAGGSRCNCSICTKMAQVTSVVRPDAFRLLTEVDRLGSYAWGGQTGTRYFCQNCGIHCFGRGHLVEVGGDYVAINLNCLDGIDPWQLKMVYWDGRHDNWEAGPGERPWPVAS